MYYPKDNELTVGQIIGGLFALVLLIVTSPLWLTILAIEYISNIVVYREKR